MSITGMSNAKTPNFPSGQTIKKNGGSYLEDDPLHIFLNTINYYAIPYFRSS